MFFWSVVFRTTQTVFSDGNNLQNLSTNVQKPTVMFGKFLEVLTALPGSGSFLRGLQQSPGIQVCLPFAFILPRYPLRLREVSDRQNGRAVLLTLATCPWLVLLATPRDEHRTKIIPTRDEHALVFISLHDLLTSVAEVVHIIDNN